MAAFPVVVVTQWIHDEAIAALAAFATPILNQTKETLSQAEVKRRCRDADAMVAFMSDWVDREVLDSCPKLRIVAAALKGFDNFDVKACEEAGVLLTIVPDLLTEPTAELVIALTLGLMRNILAGDAYVRSGAFQGWRPILYGAGLNDKVIGVIGMGAVGKAVVRRLVAFGVRKPILFLDPNQEAATSALPIAPASSLADLLSASNVVIPLVPLTADTTHLFDAQALRMMKSGAFLVNCGRGSVVDEDAVAEALETGELGGYAADVFEFEDWARPSRPRQIPERLLKMKDRTLFTPHLGSAVDEVRRDIALFAIEQIRQLLVDRKRPTHCVPC
ncbi:D-isomer-specific 2-hydroxy acid dehydrogenase superfamily [Klebsormidium nitens]|uniref:D-isomer-specific 2-hydroxy acid dehydrogenase superfamily n=1 Tax=Klebsormidium nitens TaxID=105231 RepID=A0A1Y1I6K8_KLENI|nr:D-isomer-specific 2-hydroxy acid dehydrogenase superfamily [Klebsormidium nitens]|eukprot:GAQ84356.1 D-isomer-specific 2-hydroxy acid dehydrogenase superfamily [Klebsormidium nitens]